MKNKLISLILLINVLLFLSCDLIDPDQGGDIDNTQVAQALYGYTSLIDTIEAGMTLAHNDLSDSNPEGDVQAGVSPPWDSSQLGTEWSSIFLDGESLASPKSPSEIYSDFGGSGTVRVPSSGYIQNYYSTNSELYFTLEDVDTNYYLVKVYAFPRVDFTVHYVYEEYYVDKASTLWTIKADTVGTDGYAAYQTYYTDGSIGDRTLVATYDDTVNTHYPDFGSDAVLTTSSISINGNSMNIYNSFGDVSNYLYDSFAVPATADTGAQWSSYVQESMNGTQGSKIDAEQFYTELNTTTRSGLTYVSVGKRSKWATQTQTVSRMTEDDTTGIKNIRSFTTEGNFGGAWYSEVGDVTITDGTTYESVKAAWYSDVSSGTSSVPSMSTSVKIELDSTVGDIETYTGYLVTSWFSSSNYYSIEVEVNKNTGSATMTQSWVPASDVTVSGATRSIASDQLNLILSDGQTSHEFSLQVAGGTATLSYEMGALVGTFSKDGEVVDVMISPYGVGVGGDSFPAEDLN